MNERDIFIGAVDIESPEKQAAFLDQACAGESSLRERVEALLRSHEKGNGFLESPPAAIPDATLDQPISENPGTHIGPYKLLQQIGEGGMGVVYMAEQTQPVQRKVALKVIKPGMDSRQVIARFEAEKQALALMDHVNIARVLDAGTTEQGRPYFVMELVHGVPITKYCDDNHLTPRQRLELFVPVCQAIQHAHQKGIIHRDIKPSNVMITLYDDKPVPKVIDFGVAKAIEQKLTERTLFTRYGTLVGTLEYMSPEQAEMSALGVDTRSDIYSLGVLLYELLTGNTPLDHKRVREAAYGEILRMIKEEEPPKPSTRLSDSGEALASISAHRHMEPAKLSRLMRGELDWIVMKCLEKDRNRRYETAKGFAADVQRYLNDEPVQACPPSALYRFRKFARRNKAVLATVLVVGATLLSGAVVSTWQAIRATRAAVAERQAHEEADAEQRRAEGNLDLALKALDAVYLDAIGEEKLLGQPVAKRGEAGSTLTGPPPLSALERELLKRGLAFYDQFAEQNATAPRAFVQTAQAYYRLGLLQAALGDGARAAEAYREAIRRFERLTNEAPNNAEHFRRLAEAHGGLANTVPDWDAAKKVLESGRLAYSRAIELRPNDDGLYLGRGRLLRVLNDQRAVKDFEKAIQLEPHDVEALLVCSVFYRQGLPVDLQKARDYAERAVALAPDNPRCHMTLADSLGEVSVGAVGPRVNAAAALEHYARAIELAPELHDAYTARGVFYYYVGDNHRALTDLNRALELKPDDNRVLQFRALVFTALGQFDKALADLATFARSWPHAWFVHRDTARIHVHMKNWQAAADAFTKSVEIDPSRWHVYKDRALAHANLGQYAQALADLKKALELNPKDTGTLLRIPESQLARSPEAFREGLLELARVAVERSPLPATACADRGVLYERMKDDKKAEADYAKAAQLDPKSARGWLGLGAIQMRRGNWPAAVDAFTKAVEIAPSSWFVYNRRASAHVKLGQYAQALADDSKAIELDPNSAVAHNNLAWLLAACPDAKFRDPGRAVELARKAVELDPKQGTYWNTLGVAHYRAGDLKSAALALETSMELRSGGDSFDWFFLAMTHWRLDHKEEAGMWYEQSVQWQEKNQPKNEELRRFRVEAAELLGMQEKKD